MHLTLIDLLLEIKAWFFLYETWIETVGRLDLLLYKFCFWVQVHLFKVYRLDFVKFFPCCVLCCPPLSFICVEIGHVHFLAYTSLLIVVALNDLLNLGSVLSFYPQLTHVHFLLRKLSSTCQTVVTEATYLKQLLILDLLSCLYHFFTPDLLISDLND